MPPLRRAVPPPPQAPRFTLPVGLLLCALVCGLLSGCTAAAPPDTAGRDIRAAVAAWAQRPPAELAGIPLEGWAYEVTGVRRDGARATAAAELRYRLSGYDTAAAGSAREVRLGLTAGRWRVTGDAPAPGAPPQLWDQGPVAVVRGAHSLVLGSGPVGPALTAIAAEADRAVPAVNAAWPPPWAGRLVVLVPGSLDAMAALLGRPAAEYRGMAAVTTGSVGGGPAPADRIVVNPEGYTGLTPEGRAVVLTHEAAHVATRTATSATTPLWLSEGFADWAAYRGTDPAPDGAAPGLGRAVRRGELPARLPRNEEFAFGGDPEALARAYEGAWLACRLVARRWGDAALADLYARAGREPLPVALREALGTDEAGLTEAWRDSLRGDLAPAVP
ncbi:hypothetical protein HYE82_35745 [Streptomyces sp. BR123]|uniref:hypothetical protein n=1 Tax=Streptomyces sp. BR123 TaxID=2749828 RepID=UPI0015C4C514|nr:hypothetical protein [Streptomyces sp. BR123]NXY99632.1 hypothetical protein [Streptomyces sp. BR123]